MITLNSSPNSSKITSQLSFIYLVANHDQAYPHTSNFQKL